MLHQVAAKMRSHHEELVRLLTLEQGKPIPENEEEMWWSEETFDYYAEVGRNERGRVIPPGETVQFNFILERTLGSGRVHRPLELPNPVVSLEARSSFGRGEHSGDQAFRIYPVDHLEND